LTWSVEWDDRARKELRKLDVQVQRTLLRYFRERIAVDDDPRRFGKPLRHTMQGLWRYRVGDYRLVCHIEHQRCVVLVLAVGHRGAVYT